MSVQPVHVGMHEDIASMERSHEASPHGVDPGVGWYSSPAIAQGMLPSNANIAWWEGPEIAEWRAIRGWWIAYQAATGHTASNTSIEIAGHRLAVLRKTGAWEVLDSRIAPQWFGSYGEDAVTPGDPAPWSQTGLGGGTEIQPGGVYSGGAQSIHGGTPALDLWTSATPDYDAIHMMVRHRLALRNRAGTDDRASSNFIIQAGADYYPNRTSTTADLAPSTYFPGVGVGRFVRVRNDWRLASFVVKNGGVDLLKSPSPPMFN